MIKEKIFVPLTDDLLFKEAFSHPDNRYALEDFLEAMLDLEKGYLQDKLNVSYESPIIKNAYNQKAMRADMLIKFDKRLINLECYSTFDYASMKKSTFYLWRLASNIEKGKRYRDVNDIIQINIINQVKYVVSEEYISKFDYYNYLNLKDKMFRKKDRFEIWYVRLDRSEKFTYNKLDRRNKWIRFIAAKSYEEQERIAKGDEVLMNFQDWVKKYINDEETVKFQNEWVIEIEKNKIREAALEEGIEQKQKEIAKNMLADGMKSKDIQKYTGLSQEELNAIQMI